MREVPVPGSRWSPQRLFACAMIATAAACLGLTCWQWQGHGARHLSFEQAVDALGRASDTEHACTAAAQIRRHISEALAAIEAARIRLPAAAERLSRVSDRIVEAKGSGR